MRIKRIKKTGKEYPAILKNIFNPPDELFVKGDILPSDSNAVAIVGTRRATYYGLTQCEKISYELAVRGITIISGMARGIDSAAHRGAIKARGRTIAVLGSGHGHLYPPENKRLYDEIARNGAVVSEFPTETPPLKMNFPKRNRIISGMSKGVVVVEAPERSGALITADFALEQGREVFAMPGNINSTKSVGTHRLIKEGAKLVQSVEDILEELKCVMDVTPEDRRQSREDRRPSVSPDEKLILNVLNDKSKSMDEILEEINLPARKIPEILIRLELKKLIRALPGENFVKV